MHDTKTKINELKERFERFEISLKLPQKKEQLRILEIESANPSFWNDQEKAKSVMRELGNLKDEIAEAESLRGEIKAFCDLASEGDLGDELLRDLGQLEKRFHKAELTVYLSGKYDNKNAIISIHAGQGGTEAMDWSSMLYRMYLRYAEKRGFKLEVLDESPGEEAGIKSIVFKVEGPYAYGYLKNENGTHRLVRQSPFNADKLRQTSFALLEVMPEIEDVDAPDIEIRDEDLEWQFTRAGGHGGQNVNKVSTAVRLTHIPTGTTVYARTERYQEQNRRYALTLLRAKLWAEEEERLAKEKQALQGDYSPATWGTQIRSYVLHPYKMVKDLRTGVETSNADAVLDGDLDEFIEAELMLH